MHTPVGAKAFGAMSFVPNLGPLNSDQDEELVVLDTSGRLFHFSRLSARLLAEATAGGGAPKATLLASLKRRMVTQTAQLHLLKDSAESAAIATIQLVAQWQPTLTRVVVLASTTDGAATVESWEVQMDRSKVDASGDAGQAKPPRCTQRGSLPPIDAASNESSSSGPSVLSFALVPQSTASLPFDAVARVAGSSVEWWAAPSPNVNQASNADSPESSVAWSLAGAWKDDSNGSGAITDLAAVPGNAEVAVLMDGTALVQLRAAAARAPGEESSAQRIVEITASAPVSLPGGPVCGLASSVYHPGILWGASLETDDEGKELPRLVQLPRFGAAATKAASQELVAKDGESFVEADDDDEDDEEEDEEEIEPAVLALRTARATFLAAMSDTREGSGQAAHQSAAVAAFAVAVREGVTSLVSRGCPSVLAQGLRALAPVVPLSASLPTQAGQVNKPNNHRRSLTRFANGHNFAAQLLFHVTQAPASAQTPAPSPQPLLLPVTDALVESLTAVTSTADDAGTQIHPGTLAFTAAAALMAARSTRRRVRTASLLLALPSANEGLAPKAVWALVSGERNAVSLTADALKVGNMAAAALVWRRHAAVELLNCHSNKTAADVDGVIGVMPETSRGNTVTSSTELRVKDGYSVVALLQSAPLGLGPSFEQALAQFVSSDVVSRCTPQALAHVRHWTEHRCRALAVSSSSNTSSTSSSRDAEAKARAERSRTKEGHPALALDLALKVEAATVNLFGAAASTNVHFSRWQAPSSSSSHACSSVLSKADHGVETPMSGATPRRSLADKFNQVEQGQSPGAAGGPTPFGPTGALGNGARLSPTGVAEQRSTPDNLLTEGMNAVAFEGDGMVWEADGLSMLCPRLAELAALWDDHGMRLTLEEYESAPSDAIAFALLDRAADDAVASKKGTSALEDDSSISGGADVSAAVNDAIAEAYQVHVTPYARRRGLEPGALLLAYVRTASAAMSRRPPTRVARAQLKMALDDHRRRQKTRQQQEQQGAVAAGAGGAPTPNGMNSSLSGGVATADFTATSSPEAWVDPLEDAEVAAEAAAALALTDEHMQLSERGVAALRCLGQAALGGNKGGDGDASTSSGKNSKNQGSDEDDSDVTSRALSAERAYTAALCLLRAAVPPLAPGLRALAQDAGSAQGRVAWGLGYATTSLSTGTSNGDEASAASSGSSSFNGPGTRHHHSSSSSATVAGSDELGEAARLLRIQEIVARHHVAHFNVMDPRHATRLVDYLATIHDQPTSVSGNGANKNEDEEDEGGGCVSGAAALSDALLLCSAYAHLAPSRVVGRHLLHLTSHRAPSDQELANLLTRPELSRGDALLISDQLFHYCVDGLRDQVVNPFSGGETAEPAIVEKSSAHHRLTATALSVASFWAAQSHYYHSSSSGDDPSGDARVSAAERAAFVVLSGAGGQPSYSASSSSSGCGQEGLGAAGLALELTRLRALAKEFGVELTLSSFRCALKRQAVLKYLLDLYLSQQDNNKMNKGTTAMSGSNGSSNTSGRGAPGWAYGEPSMMTPAKSNSSGSGGSGSERRRGARRNTPTLAMKTNNTAATTTLTTPPSKMKVSALKEALEARGADSSGLKADLVDRLQALVDQEAIAEATTRSEDVATTQGSDASTGTNNKGNSVVFLTLESLRHAAELLSLPWSQVAGAVAKRALNTDPAAAAMTTTSSSSSSTTVSSKGKAASAPVAVGVGHALALCDDIWASGAIALRACTTTSTGGGGGGGGRARAQEGSKSSSGASAASGARDASNAAAALKEVAQALSVAIVKGQTAPAGSASRTTAGNASVVDVPLSKFPAPLAASHALTLLQRSAALCHASQLPHAMDFLRAAEVVAAVLARTPGGEKFEQGIMHWNSSSSGSSRGNGRSGSNLRATTAASAVAAVDVYLSNAAPLHDTWDRGDGLLLPSVEAQKLAAACAFQELKERGQVHKYGAVSSANSSSISAATPAKYLTTPGGAATSSPSSSPGVLVQLSEMLVQHGASKLAMRLLLGGLSATTDGAIADRMAPVLATAADAAAARRFPDFGLAFGSLAALPQRQGVAACNKLIAAVVHGDRDYKRLTVLAQLAQAVALAWRQPKLAQSYAKRQGQAGWWRTLEQHGVPFDHRALTPPLPTAATAATAAAAAGANSGDTTPSTPSTSPEAEACATYASSLLPALLERCGKGSASRKLHLARQFSGEFGVASFVPDLLFAEHLLTRNRPTNDLGAHQGAGNGSNSDSGLQGAEQQGRGERFSSSRGRYPLKPKEVKLLDAALFGDSSAASSTSNTSSSSSSGGVMCDASAVSPREAPPVALVLRLLRGVVSGGALRDDDYERIEAVYEAWLKALDIEQQQQHGQEGATELAASHDAEGTNAERALEVLGLLRGLNLRMPAKNVTSDAVHRPTASSSSAGSGARVPLFALLTDPRNCLVALVEPNNVHKVGLLCGALGLDPGEAHALLLRAQYGHAASGSNTAALQRLPTRSEAFAWLSEVTDLGLACSTAEWICSQLHARPTERLAALQGALKLAVEWKRRTKSSGGNDSSKEASATVQRCATYLIVLTNQEAVRSVHPSLLDALAPSSSASAGATASDNNKGTKRLLRDLLEDSMALVEALYAAAATHAVAASSGSGAFSSTLNMHSGLKTSGTEGTIVGTPSSIFTVADFHAFAAKLDAAVGQIVRGHSEYGAHAATNEDEGSRTTAPQPLVVHSVRQKLVQEWLERPLSQEALPSADAAPASTHSGEDHSPTTPSTMTSAAGKGASTSGVGGGWGSSSGGSNSIVLDDRASVFRLPARWVAEKQDSDLALQIACLLAPLSSSATTSVPKASPDRGLDSTDDGSAAKARAAASALLGYDAASPKGKAVYLLLEVAHGKLAGAKHSSRTQLRALRALALVAPPGLVQEALRAQAKKTDGGHSPPPLGDLALWGVRLAHAAWLQELRLPFTGLLQGLGASLAQSLWRDHRRTHTRLAPLLADMLLAADAAEGGVVQESTISSSSVSSHNQAINDGALWLGLLSALQEQNLWRDMLELLPRLGPVLMARRPQWAEKHEVELAHVWEKVLHRPLLELQHRINHSHKGASSQQHAATNTASASSSSSSSHSALPTLASSLVFGALAPPPPPPYPSTVVAAKAATSSVAAAPAGSSTNGEQAFGGLDWSAVLPVLLLVEAGLAHCPFPDHVNATSLAHAVAGVLDGDALAEAHATKGRIAALAEWRA